MSKLKRRHMMGWLTEDDDSALSLPLGRSRAADLFESANGIRSQTNAVSVLPVRAALSDSPRAA